MNEGARFLKKVIYDKHSSKLVADTTGGVIELKQFFDGEEVGVIYVTIEEARELSNFINGLEKENR